MKTGFRSIKKKLTRDLVLAFVAIIALFALVGSVVGGYLYSDRLYDQLEAVAEAKRTSSPRDKDDDHGDADEQFSEAGLYVAHFFVEQVDGKTNLQVDAFTERLYNIRDKEAIKTLADLALTTDETKGQFEYDELNYFYYIDRDSDGNRAMVYYFADYRGGSVIIMFILAFLLLLTLIPIASRFAGRIARPMIQLEGFAEQVARRDWNAKTPVTENDEIGQLADALLRMKDALQTAEERDRRFLQAASHDLKTPIMIIKGYAQATLDGMDTAGAEANAQIIQEEATKLERRVVQLLHINSLEHALEHESTRSTIRMDRMARRLVDRFQVVDTNLQWLTALSPVEITGDSDALLIAMENIFDNQLRFAASTVTVEVLDQVDSCRIQISNDGPPFDTDDPQALFDPFRKGLEGQFGLGLSILRQVIEAHGGRVSARSLDPGVVFTLHLPKA